MKLRLFFAFLVVLITTWLTGCTYEKGAYRILEQNGYTDIQLQGHAFFMCSDDDTFATAFVARNANGKTVSGAVCDGLTKGATIRFR